ncbi:MAG: hypothetical protein ACRCXD_17215 [Luteolibacter sp.]
MTVFDRLERRWGWLAFPGFLRYYALFHVLVFILQLIRPDIGQALEFDRAKIFSGEVWRVVTMFFANSEFGNPRSIMSLIFLFFAVNFVFMVGDGLEEAWGSFKASLFYYTGILAVLMANFVYPAAVPLSGTMLYASAFLAFCTIFPGMQILLFFILPVQVRFLGMLMAAGFLLSAISAPLLLPFFGVAFANYFIWAGVPALRGTAAAFEAGKRKKVFHAAKRSASEAFHTCTVCGKSDVSDPQLDFRIGTDGEDYCSEHLPLGNGGK